MGRITDRIVKPLRGVIHVCRNPLNQVGSDEDRHNVQKLQKAVNALYRCIHKGLENNTSCDPWPIISTVCTQLAKLNHHPLLLFFGQAHAGMLLTHLMAALFVEARLSREPAGSSTDSNTSCASAGMQQLGSFVAAPSELDLVLLDTLAKASPLLQESIQVQLAMAKLLRDYQALPHLVQVCKGVIEQMKSATEAVEKLQAASSASPADEQLLSAVTALEAAVADACLLARPVKAIVCCWPGAAGVLKSQDTAKVALLTAQLAEHLLTAVGTCRTALPSAGSRSPTSYEAVQVAGCTALLSTTGLLLMQLQQSSEQQSEGQQQLAESPHFLHVVLLLVVLKLHEVQTGPPPAQLPQGAAAPPAAPTAAAADGAACGAADQQQPLAGAAGTAGTASAASCDAACDNAVLQFQQLWQQEVWRSFQFSTSQGQQEACHWYMTDYPLWQCNTCELLAALGPLLQALPGYLQQSAYAAGHLLLPVESHSVQVALLAAAMSPLLLAACIEELSSINSITGSTEGEADKMKEVLHAAFCSGRATLAAAGAVLLLLYMVQSYELEVEAYPRAAMLLKASKAPAAQLAGRAGRLLVRTANQLEAALISSSSVNDMLSEYLECTSLFMNKSCTVAFFDCDDQLTQQHFKPVLVDVLAGMEAAARRFSKVADFSGRGGEELDAMTHGFDWGIMDLSPLAFFGDDLWRHMQNLVRDNMTQTTDDGPAAAAVTPDQPGDLSVSAAAAAAGTQAVQPGDSSPSTAAVGADSCAAVGETSGLDHHSSGRSAAAGGREAKEVISSSCPAAAAAAAGGGGGGGGAAAASGGGAPSSSAVPRRSLQAGAGVGAVWEAAGGPDMEQLFSLMISLVKLEQTAVDAAGAAAATAAATPAVDDSAYHWVCSCDKLLKHGTRVVTGTVVSVMLSLLPGMQSSFDRAAEDFDSETFWAAHASAALQEALASAPATEGGLSPCCFSLQVLSPWIVLLARHMLLQAQWLKLLRGGSIESAVAAQKTEQSPWYDFKDVSGTLWQAVTWMHNTLDMILTALDVSSRSFAEQGAAVSQQQPTPSAANGSASCSPLQVQLQQLHHQASSELLLAVTGVVQLCDEVLSQEESDNSADDADHQLGLTADIQGLKAALNAVHKDSSEVLRLFQQSFVLQSLPQQVEDFAHQLLQLLPVPCCCNNPGCSNLSTASELLLVGGRSCICARCKVARYCSRDCQGAHWERHKAVCKLMKKASTGSKSA